MSFTNVENYKIDEDYKVYKIVSEEESEEGEETLKASGHWNMVYN